MVMVNYNEIRLATWAPVIYMGHALHYVLGHFRWKEAMMLRRKIVMMMILNPRIHLFLKLTKYFLTITITHEYFIVLTHLICTLHFIAMH